MAYHTNFLRQQILEEVTVEKCGYLLSEITFDLSYRWSI